MCYSAMVVQNAKKLGFRYAARIHRDDYEDLFLRRHDGEKIYINKGMEESFLNSDEAADRRIANLIQNWRENEIARLEKDLFAQKKRLADAERILSGDKPTKKATNDQRIATVKIEKFKRDLDRHNKTGALSESDSRIYPMHYLSMLTLDEYGKKIIMPIRYHMRPRDQDESFDRKYFGCYNARFDNLARVAFWKNAMLERRGIILVKKFYENVDPALYAKKNKLSKEDKTKSNIVLCFEPDDTEFMFIPMIWDVWKKKGQPTLKSGALITDEPAPEIALAGHDRTPIFLKESAIESWLSAKGNAGELREILMERETPHYSHRVMGAA